MTWTVGIDTSHVVAVGIARDGEPVARVIVDDTRAHAEALRRQLITGPTDYRYDCKTVRKVRRELYRTLGFADGEAIEKNQDDTGE